MPFNEVEVDIMIVKSEYRNKGIASLAVKKIMAYARD